MSNINVQVAEVNDAFFNPRLADNPCVSRYNLRKADFANTMTDIYEFMGDLNVMSVERGWGRFEDMLQLQALSNVLSNLLNSTPWRNIHENLWSILFQTGIQILSEPVFIQTILWRKPKMALK